MDPMKLKMFEEMLVFAGGMVTLGTLSTVATSWIKWRAPKRAETKDVMDRLNEITEQLSRLDNAVETVAVEVERISEAQRFTSKLLAERSAGALAERPRPLGSTTPH
ncbi:MAG TPA: hypothetical protein VN706_02395 [Gemmatimonadaceae bacterium]|nr:hypothetical protein [Gemmatimonadaceae bacterium]